MMQLTSLNLADMRQLGLDAVDRYLLDMIRQEAIEDGHEQPAATIQWLKRLLRSKENEVRELERQLRQPHMHTLQIQRGENAWEADKDGEEEEDEEEEEEDDDGGGGGGGGGGGDNEEQEDIYDERARQSTKRAKEGEKRSKQNDRAPGLAPAPAPAPELEPGMQPQPQPQPQPEPEPEPGPEPEPELELELQPADDRGGLTAARNPELRGLGRRCRAH
jgi:outer membrane biosynthesis protein TonB